MASKVRGEGNSVIFLNRKILPDPENERTCLTCFDDNGGFPWILKKYSIDNDYLRNTAVNFDLFYFGGKLKFTKGGIGPVKE